MSEKTNVKQASKSAPTVAPTETDTSLDKINKETGDSQNQSNSNLAIPDDVLALFPKMEETAPLERDFFSSPYIQFVDTRARNLADIIQKLGQVPNGTPVLHLPDGRKYRLDNMQVWLSPFRFQHWSVINDKNELLQCALMLDNVPNDNKTWNEFVETVAVVMTHDGPCAARIGWKTTKTPAAHEIYNALEEATKLPEKWGAYSVDHAASLAIPIGWLRAYGVIQLKAGKGTYDYVQANSQVKPTSAGQYGSIVKFMQAVEGKRMLQSCIDSHKEREQEVKKKCI